MLIPAAVPPPIHRRSRIPAQSAHDLLHEQWEYTMRTSPLYASILGDKRYNDKVDDFSQKRSMTIWNRPGSSRPLQGD